MDKFGASGYIYNSLSVVRCVLREYFTKPLATNLSITPWTCMKIHWPSVMSSDLKCVQQMGYVFSNSAGALCCCGVVLLCQ